MWDDSAKCNGKTQVALLFLVSLTSKYRAFNNTEKGKVRNSGKNHEKLALFTTMIIAKNKKNDDDYLYANYHNNFRALHKALWSPV